MKLEKRSEPLNIFEKKKLTLHDFKQKLLDFKNLTNKFRAWDYLTSEEHIQDSFGNYLIIFCLINFLLLPLYFVSVFNEIPWLSTLLLLGLTSGITYYARSLKVGIFKNRYKKWKMIKNDINNIMNDSDSICSLLLETELQLKSVKQNLNKKEDLEKVIDTSIEKLIKDMKNVFATYEGNNEDILQLLKNVENVEKYETEIKNAIKKYELNCTYYDYKKANGIIESSLEKEDIDKTFIIDFKSLL